MKSEYRTYFKIDSIRSVREDKREAEATISSTYPGRRGDLTEVLLHGQDNIDLSRGPEFPINLGHDTSGVNVGVAYNVRPGPDGKLRATLKFGKSRVASDVWEDVKSGVLKFISIGYEVLKTTKPDRVGKYFVTLWRLLEVSLVSVAMDPTVGIGRSKQNYESEELKNYFGAREESKQMTRKELQKKFDRDNKFWLGGREFKDISEFLRAVKALDEVSYVDPRFRESSLSEAADGEMVGTDFSLKMISSPNAPEQWLRSTLILLSKNTNSVKLPTFAEESRESDSILGGFKFYYVEEAGEKTASKFKLRALFESLKKTACLIYGTDELWNDSQLGNVVIPAAIQTPWNAMVVEGITTGSGAGRPLGILNADCTITVEKESGQDAGTVVSENIKNIIKHLPPESWQSPGLCWQVHKDMVPQLSTLTTAVGTGGSHAPMWHWRTGGEKFNKLCGIDVLVNPYCPSINERGTIILSDMREYIIAHKETKETTSMHFRFIYGEQAFRMVFRWDGQPSWSKAILPATGSNKISPFIVLGERS